MSARRSPATTTTSTCKANTRILPVAVWRRSSAYLASRCSRSSPGVSAPPSRRRSIRGAASDSYANEPENNGGYINLGNFGNTAQASESPAQYILVLSPEAGATVQGGTSTTITWRAFGFTGNVTLSYSANGTTFTTIASGVADNGTY